VPSLSTNATTSSPAGVYPITVSGASSPNYTITFVGGTLTVLSPPIVTIASVQDLMKKNQVIEVLVTFSGAVNATEADNILTYRLATPGKKGSYTAKNAGTIKLKSAQYSPATDHVALKPKKPFALTKPVQLLVYGTGTTGLEDSYGRYIDGGNDATAVLRRNGATINAVAANPTELRQGVERSAVDVLLEREEMIIKPRRQTLRSRALELGFDQKPGWCSSRRVQSRLPGRAQTPERLRMEPATSLPIPSRGANGRRPEVAGADLSWEEEKARVSVMTTPQIGGVHREVSCGSYHLFLKPVHHSEPRNTSSSFAIPVQDERMESIG